MKKIYVFIAIVACASITKAQGILEGMEQDTRNYANRRGIELPNETTLDKDKVLDIINRSIPVQQQAPNDNQQQQATQSQTPQGGIQISRDQIPTTTKTATNNRKKQQDAIEKERREREQREFQEKLNAQRKAAALRAQKKKEEQLKRQGRRAAGLYGAFTDPLVNATHDFINHRATVGRDIVLNSSREEWTPLESYYNPSEIKETQPSAHEIASAEPKYSGFSSFGDDKFWDKTRMDSALARTSLPKTITNTDIHNMVASCDGLAQEFIKNPPADINEMFRQKFKDASGYDIDSIMNILPKDRTPEENQALEAYDVFRNKLTDKMAKDIDIAIENSPEKKEMDAAILALDCYGDDKEGWLFKNTNYRQVRSEELPKEMKGLYNILVECNKTCDLSGFHADIYYNEKAGSYSIAFRGTEFKMEQIEDIVTDLQIGKGVIGKNTYIGQYEQAMIIAKEIEKLPPEIKNRLLCTGHSLGGGMASIVGLATGVETKTFNAATVPMNFLKEHKLSKTVKNGEYNNIKAYHSSSDVLTALQKKVGSEAIGVEVNLGDITPGSETLNTLDKASAVSSAAGVGDVLIRANGHRMKYVTEHLSKNNTEKMKSEWDRQQYLKQKLIDTGKRPDNRTQDHILVVKNDNIASFGR